MNWKGNQTENFPGMWTCLLMKGGRNSNKANAQGESWDEMLSTETPCLSSPWISWITECQYSNQEYFRLKTKHRVTNWITTSNFKKIRTVSLPKKEKRGLEMEENKSNALNITFNKAYTSGMLSISPSGSRMTPWFLSNQTHLKSQIKTQHYYWDEKKFKHLKPCCALAWTASQICVVKSKRVSFEAATSSPRITCEKNMKLTRKTHINTSKT